MRFRFIFAPLALAAFCIGAALGVARAVDADKFLVRTTNDLVALCSADSSSENYVAAVHFCHGFASGAYQYYVAAAAAAPGNHYVCLPDPPPTRSAAIAGFVEWAKSRNDVLAARPVDSMFRYLAEHYPCHDKK